MNSEMFGAGGLSVASSLANKDTEQRRQVPVTIEGTSVTHLLMTEAEEKRMFGRLLADQVIERSAKRQHAIDPYWSGLAYKFLLAYSQEHPFCFSVELVKAHAYANGLSKPANDSAWGSVVRRATRENRIVYAGLEPSVNASRHGAPIRLWRKA